MNAFFRGVGVMLGVGSLPLVLGFGICGGGDDPPPAPRGCDAPADASVVTELELGPASGDFVPGSRVSQTFGGQGLEMIGYRIAVRSASPVDCISIASATGLTSTAVNLEVESDGSWFLTDPIWMITSAESALVTVEAYDMRLQRMMSVHADDEVDAGETDAGAP